MPAKILLITAPFTQLSKAYPAAAYLKGFLEEKGLKVAQCDLSLELFTAIFTDDFLTEIFEVVDETEGFSFPNVQKKKVHYIAAVDLVIGFLQQQDIATAIQILAADFLPQGQRLKKVNTKIQWAEGDLGSLTKQNTTLLYLLKKSVILFMPMLMSFLPLQNGLSKLQLRLAASIN